MKDVSWMNHPALKNIDPRKQAILVELVNESEGKPLDKSLPCLMRASTKLKAQNLSFTPEESNLMIEILSKDMTPQDKMKLEAMKKMMQSHRGK